MEYYLNDTPLKRFTQSINELFNKSFPFHSSFLVENYETDKEYKINAEITGVIKSKSELIFLSDLSLLLFNHMKIY